MCFGSLMKKVEVPAPKLPEPTPTPPPEETIKPMESAEEADTSKKKKKGVSALRIDLQSSTVGTGGIGGALMIPK